MTKIRTSTAAEVRTWASEQGLPVADRGRLSSGLVTAFNKANRRKPYSPPSSLDVF